MNATPIAMEPIQVVETVSRSTGTPKEPELSNPALGEADNIVAPFEAPVLRAICSKGKLVLAAVTESELPVSTRERLAFLERNVRQAINAQDKSFVYELAAGSAFRAIHQARLYRLCGKNLSQYCRETFGRDRSTLSQWVQAAELYLSLGPDLAVSPEAYNQVRALRFVKPDRRKDVWTEAVRLNDGRAPLARQVMIAATEQGALESRFTNRTRIHRQGKGEEPEPATELNSAMAALHATESLVARVARKLGPHGIESKLAASVCAYIRAQVTTVDLPNTNGGKIQPIVKAPSEPTGPEVDPQSTNGIDSRAILVVPSSGDQLGQESPRPTQDDPGGRMIHEHGSIIRLGPGPIPVEVELIRDIPRKEILKKLGFSGHKTGHRFTWRLSVQQTAQLGGQDLVLQKVLAALGSNGPVNKRDSA
jgi:hypothetical protein